MRSWHGSQMPPFSGTALPQTMHFFSPAAMALFYPKAWHFPRVLRIRRGERLIGEDLHLAWIFQDHFQTVLRVIFDFAGHFDFLAFEDFRRELALLELRDR